MLSGSGGFADASPQPLCLTAACELSCWALLRGLPARSLRTGTRTCSGQVLQGQGRGLGGGCDK